MFGIFGEKSNKRTNLIKKLVAKRLEMRGELTLNNKNFVNSIGRLSAMSLPEAEIAAIVEAVIDGEKRGIPIHSILERQENLRRMNGRDDIVFGKIILNSPSPPDIETISDYCVYRNHIYSQKNAAAFLDSHEILEMVQISINEFSPEKIVNSGLFSFQEKTKENSIVELICPVCSKFSYFEVRADFLCCGHCGIANDRSGFVESPAFAKKKIQGNNFVNVQVTCGNFVIELFPHLAPKHVERIRALVERDFYTDCPFHRVIDGYLAQGGDPTGTGTGGSELPNLPAEFVDSATERFTRGTCGMARTAEPNSANSQFFITLARVPSLDGAYTIWGRVVYGMETVDKIKRGSGAWGTVENPDRVISMKNVNAPTVPS